VLSLWLVRGLWLLCGRSVFPCVRLGGGCLSVLRWLRARFGGGCVRLLGRFRVRSLSLALLRLWLRVRLRRRGLAGLAFLWLFVALLVACGACLSPLPRRPLRPLPLCRPRLCCRPALGLVASGGFLGLGVGLVVGSPSAALVVVALALRLRGGACGRGVGLVVPWCSVRCRRRWLLCCCCWLGGVVVGVVAVAGSRSLSPAFAPLVASVVRSVVASGRSVAVGCCVGADSFALAALASLPLSVLPFAPRPVCFAAFGAGGVGSCSLSAVSAVSAFAAAGGSVSFWAGGGSSVALPVRLSSRTNAVVSSASVSAVVFFSSPSSAGSLLACRLAVGRGLPVFAFACGFSGALLPLLGAGSWVAVGGVGVWSSGFRWVSSQSSFFD